MADAPHSKQRTLMIAGIALAGIGLVPLAWSFVSMSALHRDAASILRPKGQGPDTRPLNIARPVPADVDDLDWTAFQNVGRDLSIVQGELSKRFRLAGTFSMYTTQGSYYRKAILDVLKHGEQRIVAEGDDLEELKIVSILRDRIIVRDEAGREIEIWQSTDMASANSEGRENDTRPDKSGIDEEALAAFNGKYHGNNRWSFERHTLLRYYKTLHDNPDRLVRVFDSMRPVRNYENRIEGYKLAIEGEREFFAAVGLDNGDIVRAVNDVRMTNRRRAEFFLKNFAMGRNTAFIIDVERNGESERRFYQIK